MRLQERLLESCNHIGEDVGDVPAFVRSDYEDALVQAIDDSLRDGRLDAFRSWVRVWDGRLQRMPEDVRAGLLHSDFIAWMAIWVFGASLRRLMPRWEYCANKLWEMGITPPEGTGFINA